MYHVLSKLFKWYILPVAKSEQLSYIENNKILDETLTGEILSLDKI